MKQFLYCETQEGGMDHFIVSKPEELSCLYGWGEISCERSDMALCSWMREAEVGTMHEHRLGLCVRLADTPETTKAR